MLGPIITKRCRETVLACTVSVLLAACGGGGGGGGSPPAMTAPTPAATTNTPTPAPNYRPPEALDDGWAVAPAGDAGVIELSLDTMLADIRGGFWRNIDGVAAARRGVLFLDENLRTSLAANDTTAGNQDPALHRVYSVTKSVTATVVGIAIEQGRLTGVDASLYDLFPAYSPFENWDARKAGTTVEDFLTMRHGLEWDELTHPYTDARNSLAIALGTCTDYVDCLLDLPLASDPGTTFAYSTHASHALGAIVADQTGETFAAYTEQHLLQPLQIREHLWALPSPSGRAQAGSGLFLSVRDMAKLGQLYLDDGQWREAQVVPAAWVAQASSHQADLPPLLGSGYGYQWWRFTLDNAGTPVDAYAAIGFGGQYVIVIEAFDLVVAFTGSNYAAGDDAGQPLEIVETYILPALSG